MKCPDARTIGQRFVKFAPGRLPRYEEGIRNPDKDWEKETSDSEANYEQGVTNAIKRKAFGKGVKKCGTAKQQERTIEKGLIRWPEGIAGAEDEMTKAMEPVVAVIRATTLPPRYPTGDPRNYKRSEAVGVALRKAKEEGRI